MPSEVLLETSHLEFFSESLYVKSRTVVDVGEEPERPLGP